MPYELYAIKYAEHARSARANFIGGDIHDGPMPMDYFVWLIRNGKRSILVDTGFTRETAVRRGRRFLQCPADTLRALGTAPEQITDVIITHLHYDHAGNFSLFPRATFHVQDLEMQFATGRHMRHEPLREAYEVEDVVTLVREVYNGRVQFHNGLSLLVPGIGLHLIGGHTMGLQAVTVETRRGVVVLASDASHYYANMESERPFPIVYNVGDMAEGWNRLEALAESRQHIVPGHDPAVLRLYPSPSSALKGVVATLDASPNSTTS